MLCCWQKMNERNLEKQINIKFCVKIGKSTNKMLDILKMVYSEHVVKKSSVFKWYNSRKCKKCAQRKDVNVNRVQNLMLTNWRLCVQLIAEEKRNSGTYSSRGFGNEKNFLKDSTSNHNWKQKQYSSMFYLIF